MVGMIGVEVDRRWEGKQQLIQEAVAVLSSQCPPVSGETVRDRLICLLDAYPTHQLPADIRWATGQSLRAALHEILTDGIATGELRADLDVEVASAGMVGAVLCARVPSRRVVDTILNGWCRPLSRRQDAGAQPVNLTNSSRPPDFTSTVRTTPTPRA